MTLSNVLSAKAGITWCDWNQSCFPKYCAKTFLLLFVVVVVFWFFGLFCCGFFVVVVLVYIYRERALIMICQSMYYTGLLLLETTAILSSSKILRHWGIRVYGETLYGSSHQCLPWARHIWIHREADLWNSWENRKQF